MAEQTHTALVARINRYVSARAADPQAIGVGINHEAMALLSEAAIALSAPPPRWQDIATAPSDGTPIDVWLGDGEKDEIDFYCGPSGTRRSASWSYRDGKFRPLMGLTPVVTIQPTHWMPLPAPPSPEGAASRP